MEVNTKFTFACRGESGPGWDSGFAALGGQGDWMSGCKTPVKIFRGLLKPSKFPSDPQNEIQHIDDTIQLLDLFI